MAYTELVKNFNRIRDYMREFYVYGFKSREEYTKKSARSYDDERRRLESWLGDHMQFRQTAEGKNVFLSIDSRVTRHNPLYRAWKAKSFTDGDITLHFLLFDILAEAGSRLTLNEIMEQIDERLADFEEPRMFDVSTVRKKLKEYGEEGLILAEKVGKTVYYHRAEEAELPQQEVLDFFSETAPCGVIGSYLLDRMEPHRERIAFKHHYITGTMDSEVLYQLFQAMREKRCVNLEIVNHRRNRERQEQVVPLQIMCSVQSGRQYLMGYIPRSRRIGSFRTDAIRSVEPGEVSEQYEELRVRLEGMRSHMWGVSTQSRHGGRMEHVEFTIVYGEDEQFIPRRLEREKRCGTVEHLDDHTCRFAADVFDSSELVPWIRTFICRITDIHFSNEKLELQFRKDLVRMYELYGLGGDGE